VLVAERERPRVSAASFTDGDLNLRGGVVKPENEQIVIYMVLKAILNGCRSGFEDLGPGTVLRPLIFFAQIPMGHAVSNAHL
jgi:hypothetical protein